LGAILKILKNILDFSIYKAYKSYLGLCPTIDSPNKTTKMEGTVTL